MSSPVIEVAADAPLYEAFTLLRANHIQHLCVTRGGELVGIVSEHDLQRALPSAISSNETEYQEVLLRVRVEDVMRRGVVSVGPELALSDAISKLLANHVHALPVVHERQLVGILTGTDCLKTLNRSS